MGEFSPSPPEKYQVARKTRTVTTITARISRMRLEVRKEDGAEESSSVPTPRMPASLGEAWAATGMAAL